MKERDKRRLKAMLALSILFVFSMQMGWLTAIGIKPITFGGVIIPGTADDVYFKVSVKENLGAFASEDIIVNAYSDAAGTWLGAATASSGLATFSGFSVKEGSHVWLQGRQAAVASADGYVTPLEEFIVGLGDPTDTVSAVSVVTGQSILWVSNIHDSTEPTLTCRAPDGADLSGGSVDNLTTSDTYFTVTILYQLDDCWYGAPDFTDMATGDKYIGGIWIVVSQSDDYQYSQGSARYFHEWWSGTTEYHAWNFDVRLWQDSIQDGDVNTAVFTLTLANGADFDGGADTLTIDCYDMMQDTGSWSIGNFIDGGALAPVAITAYAD